jgi:hypothetical protein
MVLSPLFFLFLQNLFMQLIGTNMLGLFTSEVSTHSVDVRMLSNSDTKLSVVYFSPYN